MSKLLDLPEDCLVEISDWGNYAFCFLFRLTCRAVRDLIPRRKAKSRWSARSECVSGALANGGLEVFFYLQTIGDLGSNFDYLSFSDVNVNDFPLMDWYFTNIMPGKYKFLEPGCVFDYVSKVVARSTNEESVKLAHSQLVHIPGYFVRHEYQMIAAVYEFQEPLFESLGYNMDKLKNLRAGDVAWCIGRFDAQNLYNLVKNRKVGKKLFELVAFVPDGGENTEEWRYSKIQSFADHYRDTIKLVREVWDPIR